MCLFRCHLLWFFIVFVKFTTSTYLNEWAVQIEDDETADEVARRHGFIIKAKVRYLAEFLKIIDNPTPKNRQGTYMGIFQNCFFRDADDFDSKTPSSNVEGVKKLVNVVLW